MVFLTLSSRLRLALTYRRVDNGHCIHKLYLNAARLQLLLWHLLDSHLHLLLSALVSLALHLIALIVIQKNGRVDIVLQVHDLLLETVLPQWLVPITSLLNILLLLHLLLI